MDIRTEFWRKPIPTDRFDWSAVDNDTYCGCPDCHCPIGHGRSERAAIWDLMEQTFELPEVL